MLENNVDVNVASLCSLSSHNSYLILARLVEVKRSIVVKVSGFSGPKTRFRILKTS
jgi:hypothetical protein